MQSKVFFRDVVFSLMRLYLIVFFVLSSKFLLAETITVKLLNEKSAKSGRLKSLAVFANFSDERVLLGELAPSFSNGFFQSELVGSLNHFYSEMSHGQLDLDGEVWPKRFTASYPKDSYTSPMRSYVEFVREVIESLDRDIDLSQYDNDGPDGEPNSGDDDGYLDFLFIVVESTPVDFILGSATGIANLGLAKDYLSDDSSANGGKIRIRRDNSKFGVGGAIQRGKSFEEAIGSMAHEFGHYLGLPDLYNTAGLLQEIEPEEESGGIGYWGIMGHGNRGWNETGGPNPFCVWSLSQLGWLGEANENLIVVNGEQKGVEIADVRVGGKVYMLPVPESTSYYLIAHRRRINSYYERNLPAEGILIWLVNPDVSNNNNEVRPLVSLVCADGNFSDGGYPIGTDLKPFFGKNNLDFWSKNVLYRDQYGGNLGDSTDVWDGIRFRDFWPASNPGSPSGISVLNIEPQGEIIRADLNTVDQHRAGPILRDEIWSGNIKLVGDIWIQSNIQLEILEGTIVEVGHDIVGRGNDSERIEINVYGNLLVNKDAGNRVIFTSMSKSPMPGDWAGVGMFEQGSVFLRRTDIEYAKMGLFGERLTGNLDVGRPMIALEEVVVRLSSLDGIRLIDNPEPLSLSGVEIYDNDGYGINVTGNGLVSIENSLISRNTSGGIKREGGFIKLRNTQLIDNGDEDGVNLTLGRKVYGQILNNKMSGAIGLKCIETNEVVLKRNLFVKNIIGLHSLNSLLNISRNEWIGCDLAMKFEGVISPERLDVNVIIGEGIFVNNSTENEINAYNNWWGSANAVEIGARMQGLVNWDPFLNFDPRIPLDFSLGQPYPNPVFSETTIEYQIGINDPIIEGFTRVEIQVRNSIGLLVRQLVNDVALPGIYMANWDGCDSMGRKVASGLYYIQLKIGPVRQYRKLLVVR